MAFHPVWRGLFVPHLHWESGLDECALHELGEIVYFCPYLQRSCGGLSSTSNESSIT